MKKPVRYEQIVIKVYSQIDDIIDSLDNAILKKALLSYSAKGSALTQIDDIINIIERKQMVQRLKYLVSKVFERLDDEERALIDYKYFNNRAISNFDCKSRNYFRKQNRVLDHLNELFLYVGITKESFFEDFGFLHVVKNYKNRLEDFLDKENAESLYGVSVG